MKTKEEWLSDFERQYGRKPLPKEFVEAKQKGEIDVGINDSVEDVEEPTVIRGGLKEENITQKVFCFYCGQPNQQYGIQCVQCGRSLNQVKESKSFFSDLTSKLTEVGNLATQKTKELTQNAQLTSQIYSAKKKKEALLIVLGTAYYEKNKHTLEGDFSDLFNEIKMLDQSIQQLTEYLSKK